MKCFSPYWRTFIDAPSGGLRCHRNLGPSHVAENALSTDLTKTRPGSGKSRITSRGGWDPLTRAAPYTRRSDKSWLRNWTPHCCHANAGTGGPGGGWGSLQTAVLLSRDCIIAQTAVQHRIDGRASSLEGQNRH